MAVLDRDVIRMANQIAGQFRHKPRAEAVGGLADHLNLFWTPDMRAQLVTLAHDGEVPLDPLVIEASTALRTEVRRDGPLVD
jgi:formate dehydrogenase subunit delta